MADLNVAQLHVLRHALGLDEYGEGRPYRNHFVSGAGHQDYDACIGNVAAGYMSQHPPSELSGGDDIFIVTAAGRAVVRDHSHIAARPKLSRAKQRYRDWLDEDGSESFGEFLRRQQRICKRACA